MFKVAIHNFPVIFTKIWKKNLTEFTIDKNSFQ